MRFFQLLLLSIIASPILTKDCDDFLKKNFENVYVSEARLIKKEKDLPSFCKVRGIIEPNIGFEARLPHKNWNGKFFQAGCGGFCGLIEPDRTSQSMQSITHSEKAMQ